MPSLGHISGFSTAGSAFAISDTLNAALSPGACIFVSFVGKCDLKTVPAVSAPRGKFGGP